MSDAAGITFLDVILDILFHSSPGKILTGQSQCTVMASVMECVGGVEISDNIGNHFGGDYGYEAIIGILLEEDILFVEVEIASAYSFYVASR